MTAPIAPVEATASVAATAAVDTSLPAATLPDAQSFNAAFAQAAARDAATSSAPGSNLSGMLDPLLDLSGHSRKLAEAADLSGAEGMRPGELLVLTMRSHEFLFHCELVSNVANRSSDGLQQLFRQQA